MGGFNGSGLVGVDRVSILSLTDAKFEASGVGNRERESLVIGSGSRGFVRFPTVACAGP